MLQDILPLVPFVMSAGSALMARLRYRNWRAWFAWPVLSAAAFFIMWYVTGQPYVKALEYTAAYSAVGFMGPELWNALRAFFGHPYLIGLVVSIGAVIFLLNNLRLVWWAIIAYIALGVLASAFNLFQWSRRKWRKVRERKSNSS